MEPIVIPIACHSYSSYFEISITQHDVLRDLAIQLNRQGEIDACKRLVMPRRERESFREIGRETQTGHSRHRQANGRNGLDGFPKAEVLIINFSAEDYFLPSFVDDMPNLRALIVINHGITTAVLLNFSIFGSLTNLQSLWFEKICVSQLTDTKTPLRNMRKMCLVLCKINNCLGQSMSDLPQSFSCYADCSGLFELPSGICGLFELVICGNSQPTWIGYPAWKYSGFKACPNLKSLPLSVCELSSLKYIPQRCPGDVFQRWPRLVPGLNIKITEKCFNLDWLDE
ncbi:hypothetical protein MLD38_002078 [Melastoma candidum]|uniref:Uncharacterized protein n=1 Tax=Melastoma candidum TaxID=119954 RepID=A0ACB9SEN9_9MYRT|nr:hypothetical protein MLD38_002078 [Melastoma candidum]